jgi:GTPase
MGLTFDFFELNHYLKKDVDFLELYGELNSLKNSMINELEAIYSLEIGPFDFVPENVVQSLVDITSKINREIGVYITRKGKVEAVCVGDSHTIQLPVVEGRREKKRLTGIRCIHSHPNSTGKLSNVDIQSLISVKFDALIAVGVLDGMVNEIHAGILLPIDGKYEEVELLGPLNPDDEQNKTLMDLILERDKEFYSHAEEVALPFEKAILVGLDRDLQQNTPKEPKENLLDELEDLAITAGAIVLEKIVQKRRKIDSATYLGKGKLEEISLTIQALGANLLIFDDELTGSQIRNIEGSLGIKVIDRAALILDIFAKRALSREGKLQVELAQLKYRYPRLMGLGHVLSRLGGGIGTRGPGEKKLETDKRHIRRKIQTLENEIQNIGRKRDVLRKGRNSALMPTIAIVGYTNAGKSTLLNALSHSDVLVEDKLFATLDPTSRAINFSDGSKGILIDTVGFIKKLPHHLIESFKSTLEEVLYADLLLHVVDISNPQYHSHIEVVHDLLASIGAKNQKVLMVYNKSDKLDDETPSPQTQEPSIHISAKKGNGLEELVSEITRILKGADQEVSLIVPYNEGWVYPFLCENGKVLQSDSLEDGLHLKAILKNDKYHKIEQFVV